jgi:hypothetical protein
VYIKKKAKKKSQKKKQYNEEIYNCYCYSILFVADLFFIQFNNHFNSQ